MIKKQQKIKEVGLLLIIGFIVIQAVNYTPVIPKEQALVKVLASEYRTKGKDILEPISESKKETPASINSESKTATLKEAKQIETDSKVVVNGNQSKTSQDCVATKTKKSTVEKVNWSIETLIEWGMSCQGAVIMTGNLLQESGLDPLAVGDSGTAFGIAQWRFSRFDALTNMCNPWGEITCQFKFLVSELKSRKSWDFFTGDNNQAMKDAIYNYELYSHEGSRFEYSKYIWDNLK
jgi:Phage tail lysozyme